MAPPNSGATGAATPERPNPLKHLLEAQASLGEALRELSEASEALDLCGLARSGAAIVFNQLQVDAEYKRGDAEKLLHGMVSLTMATKATGSALGLAWAAEGEPSTSAEHLGPEETLVDPGDLVVPATDCEYCGARAGEPCRDARCADKRRADLAPENPSQPVAASQPATSQSEGGRD